MDRTVSPNEPCRLRASKYGIRHCLARGPGNFIAQIRKKRVLGAPRCPVCNVLVDNVRIDDLRLRCWKCELYIAPTNATTISRERSGRRTRATRMPLIPTTL